MRYLRMLVAMAIGGAMVQGGFAAQPAQAADLNKQIADVQKQIKDLEDQKTALKKELEPYAATLGPLDSFEEMQKKEVPYIALTSARWGVSGSWMPKTLDCLSLWLDSVQQIAKLLSRIINDVGIRAGEHQSDWEVRVAQKMLDYSKEWPKVAQFIQNKPNPTKDGRRDPLDKVNALIAAPFPASTPATLAAARTFLQWAQKAIPEIKQGLTQRDVDDIQHHGIKGFVLSNDTHLTAEDWMAFRRNRLAWQRAMFGVWFKGTLKRIGFLRWVDAGIEQGLKDVEEEGPLIIQASTEGIHRLAQWDRLISLQLMRAVKDVLSLQNVTRLQQGRVVDGMLSFLMFYHYKNRALPSKGVDVSIKNNEGKTALEYVIDGFIELLKCDSGGMEAASFRDAALLLTMLSFELLLKRIDWTAVRAIHERKVPFDKLFKVAPIDWNAVDAARKYAEAKCGFGREVIVDYLSGKKVSVSLEHMLEVNIGQQSVEMRLVKVKETQTFQLPARGDATTPPPAIPSTTPTPTDLIVRNRIGKPIKIIQVGSMEPKKILENNGEVILDPNTKILALGEYTAIPDEWLKPDAVHILNHLGKEVLVDGKPRVRGLGEGSVIDVPRASGSITIASLESIGTEDTQEQFWAAWDSPSKRTKFWIEACISTGGAYSAACNLEFTRIMNKAVKFASTEDRYKELRSFIEKIKTLPYASAVEAAIAAADSALKQKTGTSATPVPFPGKEKVTFSGLVAKNLIGKPVKIGQFGGKLEGFESVDNGSSIVIRPDTTRLVFGDSVTKAVTPNAGSDEYSKLEQQLQLITTQISDINQQAIKLQAQLDALKTPKQKELEKQLFDWQGEYNKIVEQRGKIRRGMVQDYALQRSQDDFEQRMMNLRQQQLEPLKTPKQKELENQLQDLISSPYFPTNKIGGLQFQQRRIQAKLAQLSGENLVITNNLEIRIMMSRDGQPGVRGIPQGTSIYEPLGPGRINFSEDRPVTPDFPGTRVPQVEIPEIPKPTIPTPKSLPATPTPAVTPRTKQPASLAATPLSPADENALINRLQTHTKHETLLTDILNALDVTPADAVKLGAAVKAAFERLVIMQQQPGFRTSFSWNLNALADRIRGKFNIEVSPHVSKAADASTGKVDTIPLKEDASATLPASQQQEEKKQTVIPPAAPIIQPAAPSSSQDEIATQRTQAQEAARKRAKQRRQRLQPSSR